MDLAALEIFKAVAELGGITKAAARLHRVQSNVTTRVKQLEERLGIKLFYRERRKLTLSPEGRVLLAYANRLLTLSDEALAALRDGMPRGTLRIGALESTAATRLPPILSAYHRAYPDVQIELVTGTSGALVARVQSQDVQAAFVAEPFSGHELDMQHVFTEELVLIAPKTHSRIKTPEDIGNRTIISFATGCSYRRRLEAWLGRANVVPERVMEVGSYHAIAACVAAGSGIAVVPRAVIRALRPEEEVEVFPLPASVSKAKTQLIWRRGHQSVTLDALRSALRPPK